MFRETAFIDFTEFVTSSPPSHSLDHQDLGHAFVAAPSDGGEDVADTSSPSQRRRRRSQQHRPPARAPFLSDFQYPHHSEEGAHNETLYGEDEHNPFSESYVDEAGWGTVGDVPLHQLPSAGRRAAGIGRRPRLPKPQRSAPHRHLAREVIVLDSEEDDDEAEPIPGEATQSSSPSGSFKTSLGTLRIVSTFWTGYIGTEQELEQHDDPGGHTHHHYYYGNDDQQRAGLLANRNVENDAGDGLQLLRHLHACLSTCSESSVEWLEDSRGRRSLLWRYSERLERDIAGGQIPKAAEALVPLAEQDGAQQHQAAGPTVSHHQQEKDGGGANTEDAHTNQTRCTVRFFPSKSVIVCGRSQRKGTILQVLGKAIEVLNSYIALSEGAGEAVPPYTLSSLRYHLYDLRVSSRTAITSLTPRSGTSTPPLAAGGGIVRLHLLGQFHWFSSLSSAPPPPPLISFESVVAHREPHHNVCVLQLNWATSDKEAISAVPPEPMLPGTTLMVSVHVSGRVCMQGATGVSHTKLRQAAEALRYILLSSGAAPTVALGGGG